MTLLQISFLGGYQLTHQRAKTTLSRRKVMGLLAYLAVESDQTHSRDSLVGLFWPDLPTVDARNNLRVTLSRLKGHLGGGDNLEITRHTVRFILNSQVQLDVHQFLTLIKQIETHNHPSVAACQQCRAHLKQAVDLYRGEFLNGFYLEDCLAFEEWLFVWRERLHVQVIKQLDQLIQAAGDNKQHAVVEGYARRQIELDPLQESAHRQLMWALYAQGQRTAALNQFQTCKRNLQNELGIEPEAETVLLWQEIQAGKENASSSASGLSQNAGYHLPETTTPFIGREVELAQLDQRLAERQYRLISVVGPGGMGKTRLAIQAARAQLHAFHHGVYFVSLEGVQTAAEIPAAIAEAMGITFAAGSESPQVEIMQILQNKQLLLIIDNLEHVMEGGAELLLEIIRAAPDVMLLVTTRERLNAQGEDLFRLRGLPFPHTDDELNGGRYAAVRLFTDRAHRVNKQFGLSADNLRDVITICRLVEGLPLGLELAATWVRDFSVGYIARALKEDFTLLETDLRDISPRHRSLAAVFEHSWNLLTPTEQAILPQLAVFHGGFTLSAAKEVTGASLLVLTRLRYKSLLRGGGNGRYTMHYLLRQLALRKLNEQPAVAEQAQTRHSRYFLSSLREQAQQLTGTDAAHIGAMIRLELDNTRQAWRWAVKTSSWEHLLQSAAGLVAFLHHEGLVFEGVQLLQTAIDHAQGQSKTRADLLPNLLVKQLTLLNVISPLNEFITIIEHVLSLTAQNPALSQLEAEAYLIWSMGFLDQVSDPKQARVYLDQAVAGAEKIDDQEFYARLQCEYGRNYLYDGQFDKAVTVLKKALAIFEALDHIPGQALAYSRLAPAYAEAYRLGPALFCDRKALALYTQINNRTKLGNAHNNLAETYVLLGAYEQAREHTIKSLEISRRQGNKVSQANTLSLYAVILDKLGHTKEAEKQFRAAITAQKTLKLNFSLRFSLLDWGAFQLAQGWLSEAELTLDEAITLNDDLYHLKLTAQAQQTAVYLAQGNRLDAAWNLADTVWRAIEPNDGAGLPFPIKTMVECYLIFHAYNDGRAKAALHMAADVLKRTAAEIEDAQIRTSFLHNVPINKYLRQALQTYSDPSA